MASLYEINKEYLEALNNFQVDDETGEVTFDEEKINSLNDDFSNKVDNIACYIKDLQALNEAIKAERNALEERLKANDKKVDGLKNYVLKSLEMRQMNKLETARNKLSFRKSTSVFIEEGATVPSQFIKTVTTEKIDKKSISDALKKGAVVEGCHLVETNNLQIK